MHEWALADAVVTSVLRALGGRDPRTLRSIQVFVGELQAVDRDVFLFGLKNLFDPYGLGPEAISLETEKAELACGACGRRWGLDEDPGLSDEHLEAVHFLPEAAHAFIRCPSCGSADFNVDKGRGISIGRIEVEDAGEPGT